MKTASTELSCNLKGITCNTAGSNDNPDVVVCVVEWLQAPDTCSHAHVNHF
jgi:hypothetical protein